MYSKSLLYLFNVLTSQEKVLSEMTKPKQQQEQMHH